MLKVAYIMMCLTSLLILLMFIWLFTTILKAWIKNKRSPKLTVYAKIVAKRIYTDIDDRNSITIHFITFEFESGERKEFRVGGRTYGLSVEGDCGNLSFQGTKYLGFERI